MRVSEVVRPSDGAFAGVCLAAALVLAAFQWTGAATGTSVVVRQAGEVVCTASLSMDEEVRIEGRYETVIRIEDGMVRVIHSNYPGQDCIRMGAICETAQAIVCVPNEVSVTIEGGHASVDAYSG